LVFTFVDLASGEEKMRTSSFFGLVLGLVAAVQYSPSYAKVTHQPCYVDGMSQQLQCGKLTVPLGADGGAEIELAYTLIQANPEQRSRDAVLVLAGGPGQGARDLVGGLGGNLNVAKLQRDLVFVDMRGTGDSAALACPTVDLTIQDLEVTVSHFRDCQQALAFQPEHFTSLQYVSDLERVRQAFGYRQWNLLGGSYGTRLAQLYMREHPEAIRSAVLDSIAPLDEVIGARMGADADSALERLFSRCESEPACRRAFPELRVGFADTLARLERDPAQVRFRHPRNGEWRERELDRGNFAALVRVLLYGREQHRVLPWLLDRAAIGEFEALMAIAATVEEGLVDVMALGVTANILCSEDIGRHGREVVPEAEAESFLGTLQADFWLAVCEDWPRYRVPMDYDQPLKSAIPTLLVSGELDPVTPPAYGERLLATLSNARHLVLPGGGHTDAFRGGNCINRIVNQFIKEPDLQALDTDCVEKLGPRPFFTRATGFAVTENMGGAKQ